MRRKRRATTATVGLFAVMVALAPGPAHAATSEGHSVFCDPRGFCLAAGANTAASPAGPGGACYGASEGAVSIWIRCSVDGVFVSGFSYRSPAGAATLPPGTTGRVCWEVEAWPPGNQQGIESHGCATPVP